MTDGLFLSQKNYTKDLIKLANLIKSKICATPMKSNMKLKQEDGQHILDPILYKYLVGSLIYLTTTGPDIFFVV